MPSSFAGSFASVVTLLQVARPRRVLDVGPGWGKYGLACREYLDRIERLDAIEVPQGRLPTQDAIYDRVEEADVRDHSNERFAGYDLVLLIDVVEHMTRAEGHKLLRDICTTGASIIAATPKLWFEQRDVRNPHEEHLSHWTWDQFAPYGIRDDLSTIDAIIYLLNHH